MAEAAAQVEAERLAEEAAAYDDRDVATAYRSGFPCADCRAAGHSCAQVRRAGYSCAEVQEAGYSCAEADEAGYEWHEIKDAGYSYTEAVEAKLSVEALALWKAGDSNNADASIIAVVTGLLQNMALEGTPAIPEKMIEEAVAFCKENEIEDADDLLFLFDDFVEQIKITDEQAASMRTQLQGRD